MKRFPLGRTLIIIALLIFGYTIYGISIKEKKEQSNVTATGTTEVSSTIEFTQTPPVTNYFTGALLYPDQPRMPGNYSGNTAILRAYIHKNPQSIEIPTGYRSGTISFNLKNKLIPSGYITLKSNIKLPSNSTRGRLDKTNATVVGNSYVYNIEQFPMYSMVNGKIVKGNLLKNLTGTTFTLSAFVGQNDNKVESVTFNLNK